MAGPTNAERGREVRERLLAAARELIGELGWHRVSTRVLAERAGVRPGLVHYHFESLQALLRRSVIEAMRPILDRAAASVAKAPDPGGAIETLLAEIDRYSGADPASLLFVESYLAATRDSLLRDQMRELMTRFRTVLAEALTAPGRPAPEEAAIVVMAAMDGFILHKGLDPQLSADRLAPLLRRLAHTEPNGEQV